MKKICLLGPTHPYRGGISHYTTLLCRELRRNHEVLFLSFKRQYPAWLFPGKSDKDESDSPVRIDGVEYLLDSMNPLSWLATARRIVDYQPDIFVFPWWVAFWAPSFWTILRHVRRRTRARIVAISHNALEHETKRWKEWATKQVLRQAHSVFVHAQGDLEALESLLGGSCHVVRAFHPTYADLCPTRLAKPEARKRLGIPERAPTLLFFGFVRPYKGLDVLLRAMPEVIACHRDATLLVVGEFWKDKASYLAQIEASGLGGRVRVLDRYVPNEEMSLYFGAADLVVQPYRSATGSGIAQLAYGFDRPVIGTDVGSLGEVIEDGVNGRLVAPRDHAALAAAIVESLEPEVLERLSAEAVRNKERFSWARMAALVVKEGLA